MVRDGRRLLELSNAEVKSEQSEGFCRAKKPSMKIALALVALCLTFTLALASTKSTPEVQTNLKSWTPSTGTTGIGFGASKRPRPIKPTFEMQDRQTR